MNPTPPQSPALWRDPAPVHFDSRVPAWIKIALLLAAIILAIVFLDAPIAAWTLRTHPIPDLADPLAKHGDIAHELIFLEQYGQVVCTLIAIFAVALLDPAGRRRALAIGLACLATALLTHLLKDLCGRNRPYVDLTAILHQPFPPGAWIWGGPRMGFTKGSSWGSFPSAHTSAAFALSSSLAWFYPRARPLFMCLATITAGERVLHSAHYLSDVLAGLGLAVFTTRSLLHANLAGKLIAAAPPSVRRWWLSGKTSA